MFKRIGTTASYVFILALFILLIIILVDTPVRSYVLLALVVTGIAILPCTITILKKYIKKGTPKTAGKKSGRMQSSCDNFRVKGLWVMLIRWPGRWVSCIVSIAGKPVEAMVHTGSSATIPSFELFKRISKKANVALSAPDVVLHDYNQQAIPVASLSTERALWPPEYVRSSGSARLEACLLGTNNIIPLGIIIPIKDSLI